MRAQHEVQEQTAEEMLELARALKEQSLAAHEIIKKDITTLTKTDELADRNTERLGIETERLAEHTKRACRCWIWFIMLVVSITFVGRFHSLLETNAKNVNSLFFHSSSYGDGNEGLPQTTLLSDYNYRLRR